MGREAMQPVDLVGEPIDGAMPAAAETRGRGTAEPPPRWSRGRRRALTVLMVLVVGLVSTQLALDARERAHLAHLSTVPGVLAPVDASIGTLWSTADWATVSAMGADAIGDLSVGGYLDGSGQRSAQAVRTRTGEVVWSTVLNGPPATGPREVGGASLCTLNDSSETLRRLVCLVNDAGVALSADRTVTATPATSARLVVLDPLTGDLQGQRDVPASASGAVGLLGGLAVVASRDDDEHLVVTAAEPLTGEVRWQFTSPEPIAPVVPSFTVRDASGISVSVVDGRIAVSTSAGELWVLAAAGDVIAHSPAGPAAQLREARPGRLTIVRSAPLGATGRTTTVLREDGTTGATLDEAPLDFTADDGTVPGLLFTAGDVLRAWDATTGALVWTSPSRVDNSAGDLGIEMGHRAVLLDGRIYVMGYGRHLLAIDAATGATVWEQPIARSKTGNVFTDGHALLVAQVRSGLTLTLVALAPEDGHRLWEAPLPSPVTDLSQEGNHLVGWPRDLTAAAVLG